MPTTLLQSLSRVPDADRIKVADALNRCVAATIGLYLALKVAHWNSRGPQFIALHKFVDELAAAMAARADAIAERVTGLGAPAAGTPQHVAAAPATSGYPDVFLDSIDHVRALLNAYVVVYDCYRITRQVAVQAGDNETVQLLDTVATEIQHDAGLLRPHTDATR